MKKSFLLQLGLGLVVVFGLTSCIEKQVVNPAFNPVDNTINTQFYFNISSAVGDTDPNTKQADTNVQAAGNFRGIDNASLFALIDSTVNPDVTMARKKMVEPFKATAMRDLSTLLGKSSIPTGQKGGTRIVEINLPVGVNELVFYAKATKAEISGLDSRELYGSLSYTTTPENYLDLAELIGSFAERRLNDEDTVAFKIIKDLICGGINGIFRTTAVASGTSAWYDTTLANPTITYNNGTTTESYTVTTLRWVDYATAGNDDNPVSPYFTDSQGHPLAAAEMEKILGKAYVLMAGSRYAISGGSGSSTARLLADLYNIVAAGAEATPLSLPEAVAQVLCKKMKYSIERLTDPIPNSITGERRWRAVQGLRSFMGGASNVADKFDINEFPANFHLPAGATTTGAGNPIIIPHEGGAPTVIPQITYTSAIDTLLNGGSSQANLYTYTPELCYYGNSSIRTNNSNELNNGSYPTDYSQWYIPSSWAGKKWEQDGTAISNSTRGIAMTNSIQYGVALLSSKLVLTTATGLIDNGELLSDQVKIINLDDVHYLRWTGILIGSQPEQVGWNYLLKKKNGVAAGSNAIVYDKINYCLVEGTTRDTCGINVTKEGFVGGSSTTGSDAFTNYTLLYDNVDPYADTDDAQGNVYVALEFENHLGQDFWGEQGLIRDGETFYLLAALTPNPNLTDLDERWNNIFKENGGNNHYLLPPYDPTTGETRPIRRVFVQDIMTSVDYRMGYDALKHAYISIPDLRSAKISLGLAVDLNWQAGLNYETPLGL